MKKFAVIILGLVLTKCATNNVVYVNDNPSESLQSLLEDRYECLQEASSHSSNVSGRSISASATIDDGLSCSSSQFTACLAARGWLRDDSAIRDKNAFTVPSGATVWCNI